MKIHSVTRVLVKLLHYIEYAWFPDSNRNFQLKSISKLIQKLKRMQGKQIKLSMKHRVGPMGCESHAQHQCTLQSNL